MKYCYLFTFLLAIACNRSNKLQSENASDTTSFVTNDTIPEGRTTVSKKPVASCLVPVGNPALKQNFGVQVYETPFTFQYLLRMQFGGMIETDTLKIPNFGILPVVEVRPGKEKLSCIIGFLDKKKEFKEYKMLTAKGNQMKLIVSKRYYVGVYRETK
jgi:hypothetical protein